MDLIGIEDRDGRKNKIIPACNDITAFEPCIRRKRDQCFVNENKVSTGGYIRVQCRLL